VAKYKKRSDGRYLTQIQIGFTDEGKPKHKNIYARTIKELEEKAANFRQEYENGIVVDDRGLTVAVWAKKWLETYKTGVEYKTFHMYDSAIRNHIVPLIGNYTLKQLKSHHIQEMINKRAGEGLTKTLQCIKLTINQMLEKAVENEYIYKNVAKKVILPVKIKTEKRTLTDEEILYITTADLPLKEKAFVFTLLYSGLRRGEILALTKNDIDLKKNTITVNKDVVYKKNQAEIKPHPKSVAGNRVIPIMDVVKPILVDYLKSTSDIYVFPAVKGGLMSSTAFRRMWEKVLNAFNVSAGGANGRIKEIKIAPDITPHIFRHTYATILYKAGVDIKTAQYLLGHSSITVTMDIYTHLDNKHNEIALEKLNSFASKISHDLGEKAD
jgi:integrase